MRRRLARRDPGRHGFERWRELYALAQALEGLADVVEAKGSQ